MWRDAARGALRLPLRRRAAAGPAALRALGRDAAAEFLAACLRIDAEGEDLGEAGELGWYPDRTWSGAPTSPSTTRSSTGFELYGYVSFSPGDESEEPSDFYGWADFADVTADDNPDWRMDLTEEVVGGWRGEQGKVAAMTLIWGRPLIDGGAVVTAELARLAVDQCAVDDDRFTLLAPDAYREDYLEVALYDRQGLPARPRVALRGRRRGLDDRSLRGLFPLPLRPQRRHAVDHPVLARLLRGEEAVALEVVGDWSGSRPVCSA